MSAAMKEKIYSAKVQNVNKALNLLRMRQASEVAKKFKKLSSTIDDRTSYHCVSCKMNNARNRKRKKVASSGFSRALVPIEMRKCMMRHEWSNLVELLPLLLRGRSETEPLVWRYLAAALFYSSKASLATLNDFLEMGVGSKSAEFLKNILTLPSRIPETEETEEIEEIDSS
ncbi:uncharacterized protein LOC105683560 isoform X2 [Athalia rosae]|uniref:uncharacterized protein LOC105683560 isoform X2 n=1 Tax=Athalia rosae TaxID=37344 RepID=UPI0020333F8E|nr:uncharacterized protein LOC105683560 isoform X2 [Athalia rosae]XP_048505272.1 uncharacterized protein LOC105683560 isoform X2 [Athalia rosae]